MFFYHKLNTMKNLYLLISIIFYQAANICHAQSKLLSYSITNTTSSPVSSRIGVAGYPVLGAANFSTSSTYNLFYAQKRAGAAGFDRNVNGFTTASGTFATYFSTAAAPFTKVVMNRVEPATPLGNKYTALFEISSITDNTGAVVADPVNTFPLPLGSNVYMESPFLTTMESFLNSYSVSRGTDNVFVNDATANNTINNIERIDLIKSNGFSAQGLSSNLPKVGVLLNERGGNDAFKVAAITALDGLGNVSAIGAIKDVAASLWGRVGPAISTVVLQRNAADLNERPSQCIAAQTISGIYISLTGLAITSNTQVIYGIVIFPPDFTGNPITLAGVNTNSDGNNGLDLMSGNFIARDVTAILPLTLLEFTATQKACSATLRWKTADEVSLDRFEIETSKDNGPNFKKAGTVYAGGRLSAENSYSFVLSTDMGSEIYVRLKMMDKDGKFSYSPVRVLKKCTADQSFAIYPNPAADYLNVSFPDAQIKQVGIYNVSGKKVYSGTMSGSGRISLKALAPGTYTLFVTSQDGVTASGSFIKY